MIIGATTGSGVLFSQAGESPEVIQPIAHEQLLWLFIMLTLLLLTARVLGEIARRLDLPAVVGELMAGIVLGPSLLNATGFVFEATFPEGAALDAQFHLIEVVAWIGLLMLIILTGLETDLDLIISRGVDATIIALASIIVPFLLGFGFAWILPDRFIAVGGNRLVFSLFIGTALSISAIPVIAKILMDMEVIRRDFGQIKLAAGMINDTIGWIMLALVAGLAREGRIELTETGMTILYLVVFLGIGFTIGQRIIDVIIRWVDTTIGGQAAKITAVVILSLGVGSFTHWLHLEAVLGAFVVGILVGQVKRFDYNTEHTFEIITLGVFAPIFFATAGLRVDIWTLTDPTVFLVGIGALGLAIVGKFVGSYVGSIIAGLSHWEGVTMGFGLNARGAMEIIVAMIGLGLGVLTIEMYSIIVMIAIVTSLMAPPLLRVTIPRLEMSEEERERLEAEEQAQESFLLPMTTMLLPTRCGIDSQYAARLIGQLTQDLEITTTAMYLQLGEETDNRLQAFLTRLRASMPPWLGGRSATEAAARAPTIPHDAQECLDVMQQQYDPSEERTLRRMVREEKASLERTIVTEAENDYDMLVIGTAERGARAYDPPLGDLVDEIIRDAPCPVMAVHANAKGIDDLENERISRILLPTTGMEFNRHAAEVAFEIARNRNVLVEVIHVVNETRVRDRFVDQPNREEARKIGEAIVDEEAELGREMGAEVRTRVVVSQEDAADEILRVADEQDDDLIVMGTGIRPVSGRTYFGHTAERIVRDANAAVAVIASR